MHLSSTEQITCDWSRVKGCHCFHWRGHFTSTPMLTNYTCSQYLVAVNTMSYLIKKCWVRCIIWVFWTLMQLYRVQDLQQVSHSHLLLLISLLSVDMSAHTCSVLSSHPAYVVMQVQGTTMWIPNYVLKIQNSKTGTKEQTAYTPFVAILTIIFSYKLSLLFHQEMDCVCQDEDVTHDMHKMTLGPYSFQIFMSDAWTELHIGGVMPQGWRPLHLAGKSHFKHSLASQLKEVVREQKRPRHKETSDENSIPEGIHKVDGVLTQRRTWRGCNYWYNITCVNLVSVLNVWRTHE